MSVTLHRSFPTARKAHRCTSCGEHGSGVRMTPDRALFAQVAPRLERAHRERIVELAAAKAERRHVRAHVLACERLVAHRSLQLARSYVTGDRRYMRRREDKLRSAQEKLRHWQARADRIGA